MTTLRPLGPSVVLTASARRSMPRMIASRASRENLISLAAMVWAVRLLERDGTSLSQPEPAPRSAIGTREVKCQRFAMWARRQLYTRQRLRGSPPNMSGAGEGADRRSLPRRRARKRKVGRRRGALLDHGHVTPIQLPVKAVFESS